MADNINRKWNSRNPYQGTYKRVLCVCSAGLLRSPTLAWILSNPPYDYNTRAAGLDIGHALIPVDEVLLEWADEIICMNKHQQLELKAMTDKPVINLNIGDNFEYRDKGLIKIMKMHYEAILAEGKNETKKV